MERAINPQHYAYTHKSNRGSFYASPGTADVIRRAQEFEAAERGREEVRRKLWPRRLQLLIEAWRTYGDGPRPPLV